MLLRCTARLLSLLRCSPGELISASAGPDDWYANLFWVERRKCLLLVHADTLFPIFVADVRAAQLRPLGAWLTGVIGEQLRAEHLPVDVLGGLDPGTVQVAKTVSRQVLGVMNDLAVQIELSLADTGGLAGCDLARVNQDLRRTLYQREGHYATPMDRVAARLPRPPAGQPTGQPAERPARPAAPPTGSMPLPGGIPPVAKRSWLDGRVEVLLGRLRELGLSASRTAAAAVIQDRVQLVGQVMGISEVAARRHLTDDAVAELAANMAFAVAEETPGADLLEAPRTAAVPLPVLGRAIAGLAETIHVRLAEPGDLDHLRVGVAQLAHALSAFGQLTADTHTGITGSGSATGPAHLAREPVVLLPPALLHRAARYLETAAALIHEAGVLPDELNPAHAGQLAAAFLDDAATLRRCAGG